MVLAGRARDPFDKAEAERTSRMAECNIADPRCDAHVSCPALDVSTRQGSVNGLRTQAIGVGVDGTLVEQWLVSSAPDVVSGARASGLSTARAKLKHGAGFDPWAAEPNVVVTTLEEMAGQLAATA